MFIQTSAIDFTEIAVHYPGRSPAGLIFNVSSCGKFLMAANGCLVYLYELNRTHKNTGIETVDIPGALRPVTSIICPRRVLACSMDTSSNRYVIAILLDGRMGLVCDINTSLASASALSQNGVQDSRSVYGQSLVGSSETVVRATSFLDRVSLRTSATAGGSNNQVWETFRRLLENSIHD